MNIIIIDDLRDIDHYYNFLKIIDWDGYSKWDRYDEEKLLYLHFYRKFVMRENEITNWPVNKDFEKLYSILNWDSMRQSK